RDLRPRWPPGCGSSSSRPLEEGGLALAHADAHRGDAVAPLPAAKLVEQRDDEPGATHPERVADCDRAAVHGHLLLVQTELAHDGEALGGKGFVQLHQIEVADIDA